MSLIDTLYSSLRDAYLYRAMGQELLDTAGRSATDIADDFASNCVSLAEKEDLSKTRVPLLRWIIDSVNTAGRYSIAFFGRSVYGGRSCGSSDVEAVLFVPEGGPWGCPLGVHPAGVTLLRVQESTCAFLGFQESDLAYLFAGPALFYPSPPHQFAVRRIDSARRRISTTDGSDGIMARITHAASKVLNKQEEDMFDSPELASRFRGCSLTRTESFRMVDFGDHPDIALTHHVYEKQLAGMDEMDLSALVKAAMRRIRVKEEHREGLARRYIEKIKK